MVCLRSKPEVFSLQGPMAYAQRGRHFTLKDACKEFRTKHQKIDHEPTGQITLEEIRYCRRDAVCTLELLNALKREYDSFPISLQPERARPLRRTGDPSGHYPSGCAEGNKRTSRTLGACTQEGAHVLYRVRRDLCGG